MSKKESLIKSFGYAGRGLVDALRDEPNLRIHLLVTVIVIILGFIFRLGPTEWAVLTVCVTLVISLELINTVLEEMVDLASPEISETARKAKDISAAAVFTSSVGAILVGLLLFLPKILQFVFSLAL
ncbi:MAG: diacylglycerol kinase family protein [Patescibacteria group bacterium]